MGKKNVFPVILHNRTQFRYKLCHQAYLVKQFLGSKGRGKQGTEFKGPPAVMVSRVTVYQIDLPVSFLKVPSQLHSEDRWAQGTGHLVHGLQCCP